MELGLKGKIAVVTGGSRGLGFSVAEALLREGSIVAIGARTTEELAAAAADLVDRYPDSTVLPVPFDVRDAQSVEAFADRIRAELGDPDILVSNAGGPPSGSYDDVEDAQYQAAFELCFMSAVRLFDAFLPAMRKNGYGRVVHLASVSARQPLDNLILSNATRAAVLGFAKTVANRVAKDGVTVNVVLPGYARTERLEELADVAAQRTGLSKEQVFASWEAMIPMARIGEPHEIADAVTFLCSAAASYVTGTTLAVDGGLAVEADERDELFDDVALVCHVALDAPRRVVLLASPGLGDVRFGAVELHLLAVDEVTERIDHAVRFPFVRHAGGRGEHQQRHAEVTVLPEVDLASHRDARDLVGLLVHGGVPGLPRRSA
jgi:3-oxoacyl-[acyl-carrier protein] reductase